MGEGIGERGKEGGGRGTFITLNLANTNSAISRKVCVCLCVCVLVHACVCVCVCVCVCHKYKQVASFSSSGSCSRVAGLKSKCMTEAGEGRHSWMSPE